MPSLVVIVPIVWPRFGIVECVCAAKPWLAPSSTGIPNVAVAAAPVAAARRLRRDVVVSDAPSVLIIVSSSFAMEGELGCLVRLRPPLGSQSYQQSQFRCSPQRY